MDNPYSSAKAEFEHLLHDAEVLRSKIIESKQRKGEVNTVGVLLAMASPDHSRSIKSVSGDFKRGSDLLFESQEANVLGLITRASDIVISLPTGLRKCELKVSVKRAFIQDFKKAARKKATLEKLKDAISVMHQVVNELSILTLCWTPRTKVIDKGRLVAARLELERILSTEVDGYLKVCDGYTSEETLAILEATPKNIPITLFTFTLNNEKRCVGLLKKMNEEGHPIRVYIMDNKQSFPHDRFIICASKAWSLGASMMDFGNKMTMITLLDNRS
jgi:hypothetical protein